MAAPTSTNGERTAYPLSWPVGWPRARSRQHPRFKEHSMSDAVCQVIEELRRMGVSARDVVISTNVEVRLDGLPYSNRRRPEDPGAAVYFRWRKQDHVLACDLWPSPELNLWAIGLHIAALRGQERWGVGSLEQAFTGYKALPEPNPPWWQVLDLPRTATLLQIKSKYRALSMQHHPDRNQGDAVAEKRFKDITRAYAEAKKEKE